MQTIHVMSAYEVCKTALGHGFVKFAYIKKDGTYRVAIGTRCPEILGELNAQPNGGDKENCPSTCAYYDIIRGGWRCFRIDAFKEMLFDNMSVEKACTEALTISLTNRDGLETCLMGITKLIGERATTEMMNFAVNNMTLLDADELDEYEEKLRTAVFPNVPVTAQRVVEEPTTQMSSSDNKEDLIKRLMELRREEDEILAKLLRM